MQAFEKWLLRSAAWRVAAQRLVVPWVLRQADLPPEAEVLEVGAGGGFGAEALLVRFPGWRITATDYDSDMVDLAGSRLARFGERARVEGADAAALQFADGSFDLVVSIGVLHHVGAWEQALAESRRVLRPGGRLLLADLLRPSFVWPVGAVFPPVRTYSLAELRGALAAAGFARWWWGGWPFWCRVCAEAAD